MTEQRLQDASGEAIEDAGGFLLPHVRTFAAIWNTFTRTYRYTWDEAIKHSPTNALTMRRDAFVMGCLQERYLQVAQLPWHLDSPHGRDSMNLLGWMRDIARYIPLPSPVGTSVPRDRAIEAAKNEIVVCFDPHVYFTPGAINAVRGFFESNPDSKDLVSGPLLYDDLKQYATHFDDVWRGEMWGIWAKDERGDWRSTSDCRSTSVPLVNGAEEHKRDACATAFEIPGCGLGAFAVLKKHWPGFNPHFRGFGGEEMYVHEKIRRRGGRNLCLPAFAWAHRFGRPDGVKYPLTLWNKVRNYVIGHRELGLPLDRIHRHFVEGWNEDGTPVRRDQHGKVGSPPMTEADWKALIFGDVPPETPPARAGCGSCAAAAAPDSIDKWYEKAAKTPGDFNEHVPTLRELASRCDHVTEFGGRRGVSSVAILAAQPKRFVTYDLNREGDVESLLKLKGKCDYDFRIGDFGGASASQSEIEETDLLFIDSKHTGEHLLAELMTAATNVRRWIALHDTVAYGDRGEDGSQGLLAGVRTFLKEHREWTVVRHDRNNNGLMVLSRDDAEKVQPPGAIRKMVNFSKALAEHARDGMRLVDDKTYNERLELCIVCPNRHYDSCGLCGCPVDKKCSWASEQCPANPPKWEKVA